MQESEWLTQLEETGKVRGGGDSWALSGRTEVLERFAEADANAPCPRMLLAAISAFQLDMYMR